MKNESTVKTYSGLLNPSPEAQKALDDTYAWYNRGAVVFQELILNLYGAMTPAIAQERFVEKKKKSKKKKKKKTEDRTVTPEDYPTIGYMLSVFSLETKCADNENYVVPPDRIPHLFRKYWTNEGGGEYNEWLVEMIAGFVHREDFAFIDRKRMYTDWTNSCGAPILTDTDVKFLLETLPFPKVQGTEDNAPSQRTWRVFFSTHYGTSEKTDWNHRLNILFAIKDALDHDEIKTYSEFTDFVCKKSGITPEYVAIGKPPWYIRWFKEQGVIPEKSKSDKRNQILKNIAEAERRLQFDELFPSVDRFKDWLEKSFKCTIEKPEGGSLRDEFSEMAGQAHGKILSTRSNAINRCCDKIKCWNKWESRPEFVDAELLIIQQLEENMAETHELETYEIRPKQFAGLPEFHAHWSSGKELEESLEDAARASEGKFAYTLFRGLGENFPEIQRRKSINELKESIVFLDALRRYNRSRLGGYVRISDKNPISFVYGDSRPKVNFEYRDDRLAAIRLRLLTNEGWQMVTIDVKASRAVEELFRRFNGTGKAFRNHQLDRIKLGVDEPAELYRDMLTAGRNGKVATRLRLGGQWYHSGANKWYVDFQPKLEYEQREPLRDFDIHGKQKVMGIDLGWKNAAAYGILRLGEGDISVGKHQHPGDYIEKGVLQFSILKDGKKINLLESEGSFTNAADVAWANDIFAQLHQPSKKYPNPRVLSKGGRYVVMLRGLVEVLRRAIRRNGATAQNRQILLEIAERLSPWLLTNAPIFLGKRKNTGGLTLRRIELFHSLYAVAKSYLDSLPENDSDEEIEVLWRRAMSKYNNVRRERYRVTAAMIMRKAIESDVKVVVFEDLDGATSASNSRYLNRGISRWYSTRIIDEVTTTLAAYGINVVTTDRAYSSHTDVNDTRVVRLSKVEVFSKSTREKWAKEYNVNTGRKTMNSSRSANSTSEVAKMRYEHWNDYLGSNNITSEKQFFDFVCEEQRQNRSVMMPIPGGDYIKSSYFGELVPSDIIAACQVAKRGAAYVVSSVNGG